MILLGTDFYQRPDTEGIARELLGTLIITETPEGRTAGIITETEAYCGTEDRACHAFGGRHTRRNEPMYKEGGIAYVYLCYGIHSLFNVVTHAAGEPHAVLIRGIRPVEGLELMLKRRSLSRYEPRLTRGPGALSAALGIHTGWSGTSLQTGPVRICASGETIAPERIRTGPRIGVGYAGADALLLRRFWIEGEPSVSKPA